MLVTESIDPEQAPHRVAGVTRRTRQIVGIDCAVTMAYDVKEASGSAVLVQTLVVRLRTRPLRRGIAYGLDCAGPLIVELPADATAVGAAATGASGAEAALPVRAPLSSLPLAFGKRLRAEPGTQLALVEWPGALAPGDYHAELRFSLPDARPFREKAIATASVACGRSRYFEPILPSVSTAARAPAFAIDPSAGPVALKLPRLAAGIASHAEVRRMLSCAQ